MIDSIRLLFGLNTTDYDVFLVIIAGVLLIFVYAALLNIFHALFKGASGW